LMVYSNLIYVFNTVILEKLLFLVVKLYNFDEF